MLGLCCCMQAFSSCGERGLLFIVVRGLFIAVASLVCIAWALGAWASVIVAHGLSCSAACGIFPDQGSNLCPLHWQVDSQPLRHQGSPQYRVLHNWRQNYKANGREKWVLSLVWVFME